MGTLIVTYTIKKWYKKAVEMVNDPARVDVPMGTN